MHSVNKVTRAKKRPRVLPSISSTGKRKQTPSCLPALRVDDAFSRIPNREVRLGTEGYKTFRTRAGFLHAVDGRGERIESVSEVNTLVWVSNRKDKRKAAGAPLLIAANSSRMLSFAEPQHANKVAADEVVMDRGAESTAGGFDVI